MKTLENKIETLRTEEIKFDTNKNAGNVVGLNYFNGNETPILKQVNGNASKLLKNILINAWAIKQKRSKRGTIFYSTYIERAITHSDLDVISLLLPKFNISFYQASKSAENYMDTENCQNYIKITKNGIEIELGRGTGAPSYQSFWFKECNSLNLGITLGLGIYYKYLNEILDTEFSYSFIKNDRY